MFRRRLFFSFFLQYGVCYAQYKHIHTYGTFSLRAVVYKEQLQYLMKLKNWDTNRGILWNKTKMIKVLLTTGVLRLYVCLFVIFFSCHYYFLKLSWAINQQTRTPLCHWHEKTTCSINKQFVHTFLLCDGKGD